MKKVIGLYGRAEIGKTMTLNYLIDLLEVSMTGCTMPAPQPSTNNRRMAFKINDIIVGVGTWGDNEYEVTQNCIFFKNNNCDIAFSATRTRGGSCDALKKYAEEDESTIKWIKKNIVDSDFEEAALIQAQELFNLIK
jgi:hypothetical protein